MDGLILCGKVASRVRKMCVNANNEKTELITYVISNGRDWYVNAFNPQEYLEIDSLVELPVRIRPYLNKQGIPTYSLNIVNPNDEKVNGEVF